MKRLAAILVLCLAVLAPARGETPFLDDSSVSHWMAYYYVDKDTANVGAFVHWLAALDFTKNPSFVPPTVGFLAAVFLDNPAKVRGWIEGVQPNEGAKAVIERALWLSGHGELIGEVYHDTPAYAATKPVPFMEMALDNSGAWDTMWAAFSATGDTRYPARLIDLLDENAVFTGNKNIDAIYRSTVAWSLSSNMWQHELILRLVRREAERRTGAVQQKLKDMLARIDQRRVDMPNCEGDFCALMALVSEDNLQELDKPYDQGPQLRELSKAKTGDRVAVVFAFGGMALAEDLSADVSYDIKIVGPGGTVYGSEHTNLPALKGKVAMRFNVFDNRPTILMIRFEPQDPRGTYRVEAVIKDNIGGKQIKLVKEIVLEN